MARTSRSSVTYRSFRRRTEFVWPQQQFNLWLVLVITTAAVLIGIFATFLQIQNQMQLGSPWLFPYGICVGCITILLVIILVVLSLQDALTPGILMVFCFVLFVLYMTGLVDTGIQLFGTGNVHANCINFVNNSPVQGVSGATLAWLQQNSICNSWYAVFAFWLVGTVVYLLMIFMAFQVSSGSMD